MINVSGKISIGKIVNQPGSSFNGEVQEKYNVVLTGFVARNMDNTLKLFIDVDKEQFRRYQGQSYEGNHLIGYWDCIGNHGIVLEDFHLFPDVKWEDEYPTEVNIRIF